MKTIQAMVLAAIFSVVAPAGAATPTHDLENCVYKWGAPMPPNVCRQARQQAAGVERARAETKAAMDRDQAARQARAQQAAEVAERARERREREQAEQAARKEQQEQEAQARRVAEAKAERQYAEREASRRTMCGADYKNMRVGMTIARAQECVAALRLTGQVNRADAVVSMYEGAGIYAQVIAGKVVAWTR